MTPSIEWPESLPAPQLIGKAGQVTDPQIRTHLASGRTRTRIKFDAVPVSRQVDFVMTSEQADAFENFHHHTTKNGTIWFSMKLSLPQGDGPWPFQFVGALPVPTEVGSPSRRLWRYSGVQLQQWLRPTD